VPYLVFGLLLLAVEGGVRATRPNLSSLDLFVTAPEQQAQFRDAHDVRIFEGDPLLFWRLLPNLREAQWDLTRVTTNAQGLRYDHHVGPKAKGALRVLCFGDSVTFGYRVPLVFVKRPDEYNREWVSYPVLLERRLRAANPGRTIEVLPLAVPGYSSHQGLLWARRDLARFEPDLVTACFGWNDISRRRVSDRDAMPTEAWNVAGRALLARSQALAYLWRLRQASSTPESASRGAGSAAAAMRVGREEHVENVLGIARLAREKGAHALVIGAIYRDRDAHPPEGDDIAGHRAALRAAAEREEIPYLEIPELTESHHPENTALFGEHIHPNHRGHRLMADRVLQAIAAHSLLPGVRVSQ
jgi:lysophospholipase L1-like esterase